ncbi:hypothetical protein [Ferruginibacter sp. SUN106]|uniref:hypothetical protein n=1 Tax=Ferruginibacter sp. SUN106 TaxID=2978348 RepID=UPI003D360231
MRYLSLLILFAFNSVSAQKTVQVHNGKGDNVAGNKNIKNVKNIYKTYQSKGDEKNVLNFSKYIDVGREIRIVFGTNSTTVDYKYLILGFDLGEFLDFISKGEFKLRVSEKKLYVNAKIFAFDEKYIAVIKDNELISPEKYHITKTDSSIQIFDEYYYPTFQLQFFKKYNCIYIGGIFNTSRGYTMFSPKGTFGMTGYNKLLLSQASRDSILLEYKKDAENIKPLDEIQEELNKEFSKFGNAPLKKQNILNNISSQLCNCIMRSKDTLKTRDDFFKSIKNCYKGISPENLNKLFKEQELDINSNDDNGRMKDLLLSKLHINCEGYEKLLSKLKN